MTDNMPARTRVLGMVGQLGRVVSWELSTPECEQNKGEDDRLQEEKKQKKTTTTKKQTK